MKIEFNLNKEVPKQEDVTQQENWVKNLDHCKPFLVREIDYLHTKVGVRTDKELLLFNVTDPDITYVTAKDQGWAEDNYQFIRYLEPGESFTVTV